MRETKRGFTCAQTPAWLHLRGPSGPAGDVPIVDGLLVGRGAIGLAHSKKISRQHIVVMRGATGWLVQRRGGNPAVLRRPSSVGGDDPQPILLQPAPATAELRAGDTISLAGRLPEHTLEVVAVGDAPTAAQLARAAAAGHRDAVASIIAERVLSVDHADPRQHGRTALHLACLRGHTAVARLLLDARADARRRDDSGDTPLHLAAWRGNASATRLLAKTVGVDAVDTIDGGGDSALHLACHGGHLEAAHMLLKAGASVLAMDRKEDSTVAVACGQGHADVVSLLLAYAAPAARSQVITSRNRHGLAPIHVAALRAHAAAAAALLRYAPLSVLAPASSVTPVPRKGHRIVPLFLAMRSPRLTDTSIIRLLLDAGAAVPIDDVPAPLGTLRPASGQPCSICGQLSHRAGSRDGRTPKLCRQVAAMLRVSKGCALVAAQQRLAWVWVAERCGVVYRRAPSRHPLGSISIPQTGGGGVVTSAPSPVRLCVDLFRLVVREISRLNPSSPAINVCCRVMAGPKHRTPQEHQHCGSIVPCSSAAATDLNPLLRLRLVPVDSRRSVSAETADAEATVRMAGCDDDDCREDTPAVTVGPAAAATPCLRMELESAAAAVAAAAAPSLTITNKRSSRDMDTRRPMMLSAHRTPSVDAAVSAAAVTSALPVMDTSNLGAYGHEAYGSDADGDDEGDEDDEYADSGSGSDGDDPTTARAPDPKRRRMDSMDSMDISASDHDRMSASCGAGRDHDDDRESETGGRGRSLSLPAAFLQAVFHEVVQVEQAEAEARQHANAAAAVAAAQQPTSSV